MSAACAECTRPAGHYDVCSRSPRHRLAEAERKLIEAALEMERLRYWHLRRSPAAYDEAKAAAKAESKAARSVRHWQRRAGVRP